MRRSWLVSARLVVLSLVMSLLGGPAHADGVADAEDLFRRGKALMASGSPAQACPLFQESQRLDPQTGTLFNLALCHEAIGRVGAAWAEFRAVEQRDSMAQPARAERAAAAREHAAKLEPRLSRIRLVVPPEAHAPGLVIKVDGEEKREPTWTNGIIVDVGTSVVEASAPGKVTRTLKTKIEDEGTITELRIEPLVAGKDAPKPATADLAQVDQYAANRARRTTGYVVGGIGLGFIAASGAFGIAALVNNNDAHSCPAPCFVNDSPGQVSDRATDRALLFANLANALLALGVVGAGVGTWLVLTSGPTKAGAVTANRASLLGVRW
jgi:hypothetical protein